MAGSHTTTKTPTRTHHEERPEWSGKKRVVVGGTGHRTGASLYPDPAGVGKREGRWGPSGGRVAGGGRGNTVNASRGKRGQHKRTVPGTGSPGCRGNKPSGGRDLNVFMKNQPVQSKKLKG